MATRLRKVRRLRGSRTHGWGQIGQHRRTGAKGGSGMAGLHKHKWSYTVKYAPDHFGSNKWHPPNRITTNRWINLYQLDVLAGKQDSLDLGALGIDKLLGQGSVTKAYKLRVSRASSTAIEKIKAAGGIVEVLASTEPEKEEKIATRAPEKPTQKK